MAAVTFSVWNSQTFTAPENLVAGVPVCLAQSSAISNATGQKGCRVVADFLSVIPDAPGGSFELTLLIEGKSTLGNWYPVAYQFSPFKYTALAPERQLILQPDISDFNTGIDDSVYVSREIARISRMQGFLPSTEFRVCLMLMDNNPGPNGFQSVTVTAVGERYDVS
jgi:hypothetical protein